jgi:ABC-type Fe3+ transport system permease subunit
MTAFQKKLLVILAVLAVLSPLGIILPEQFKAGDAWGEWSMETIQEIIGFVPEKMKETADLWQAPIPDYNLGDEKSTFSVQALSYILSAVVGIALCILIVFGLSKLLVKKKE